MSPCPEAPRKHAISTPVTIILEALRRPSRFPTLPPPTSVVTVTDLLCHCHQPPLSLSPTIYVQITLCHRKVPRPPAGPLMRTAAHPASTIDPVSARKKLPTTQNITPPHQAIGSIRFPHRSACLKCFRLGRFGLRAASAGLKCFRLGLVRFPRCISRPEVFSSGSVMTGGPAGPSTRCAHDRPTLPDPVGHVAHGQNAVQRWCP